MYFRLRYTCRRIATCGCGFWGGQGLGPTWNPQNTYSLVEIALSCIGKFHKAEGSLGLQVSFDYMSGNQHGNTKKGPIKTTALLKGDYMRFDVSLGERISFKLGAGVCKLVGALLGLCG